MALSDAERARAYRARKKAGTPHTPKPCGTWAAYMRHKRAGEQPCEPCIQAMRTTQREAATKRRNK